jgi:hypothetical protein
MILATHGIVASQIVTVPVATAATGVGETSFTANWNAYTGADYYLLDISEFSNFSTFVYEDQIVLAPNTSYVVIGLNPNTTYYYRLRANIGYDPDAQAFFNRVTTAGGTLSATEQNAVNTLVIQMKIDGIWTLMKAIYPMVGASAAACAQNLKSSSFTGTFTSGWTFASTGVTPNGTSAYMDTGLTISSAESINFAYGGYTRTNTGSPYGVITGARISGSEFFIAGKWTEVTNQPFLNMGTSGFIFGAENQSPGLFQGSRTATNAMSFRRNNASLGTSTFNETAKANTSPFYIGAASDNNSPAAQTYTPDEIALVYYCAGLTNGEMDNLYTAVQAFQTTLARQV